VLRNQSLDALARSWAGVGSPAEREQRRTPKNGAAGNIDSGRSSSGRSVLTADDITAAVAARLEGVPAADVLILAKQFRPLAGDFREDRPEVQELLNQMTGGAKRAWSLACAVIADDARRRGNIAKSVLFGFAVVDALRQTERAKLHTEDALSQWIRDKTAARPELIHRPSELWAIAVAEAIESQDGIFDGYKSLADAIDYETRPGGRWKEIDKGSFCRRLSRVRAQAKPTLWPLRS